MVGCGYSLHYSKELGTVPHNPRVFFRDSAGADAGSKDRLGDGNYAIVMETSHAQ